ncbi:MAG: recombinase zinc beta ribbon domain-containing protein [Christensenellales bacterium]
MRTGNGMNFGRIAAVAPGMTYEYVATATNGWNAVVIGSKVGWVSGKYYAEGTHPAIISPETFAQACALRERNRQANGIECDAPQYSVFTQMIVCDKCGKYYRRKVSRTETAWNCSTYLTMGKAHCHTKQVPEEDILMKSAAAVLGLTQFDEAVFKNQIQQIRVPCFNHLVFVFKDGRREERIWQDKSRASRRTRRSMYAPCTVRIKTSRRIA